jgi:hypothetical protein
MQIGSANYRLNAQKNQMDLYSSALVGMKQIQIFISGHPGVKKDKKHL